jgi:hypothetical protein
MCAFVHVVQLRQQWLRTCGPDEALILWWLTGEAWAHKGHLHSTTQHSMPCHVKAQHSDDVLQVLAENSAGPHMQPPRFQLSGSLSAHHCLYKHKQ